MRRRACVTALCSAVALVVVGAAPAFAHVDPDPLAVQVGTTATIGFGVEHGCSGSPTTRLEIQVPPEVTNVKPIDKAGWTATLAGSTVTFAGGQLDAATKDHFDLSLTAPATPGLVHFPVVQTCVVGVTRWIEIGEEGKPEPELPAATLKVTAGAPTVADLTPADDTPVAKKSSSHTGLIVGIVAAVVAVGLLGVGASMMARRRRGPTPT